MNMVETFESICRDEIKQWKVLPAYGRSLKEDFASILHIEVKDAELASAILTSSKVEGSANGLFYIFTVLGTPVCLVASNMADVNVIGQCMYYKWLM